MSSILDDMRIIHRFEAHRQLLGTGHDFRARTRVCK